MIKPKIKRNLQTITNIMQELQKHIEKTAIPRTSQRVDPMLEFSQSCVDPTQTGLDVFFYFNNAFSILTMCVINAIGWGGGYGICEWQIGLCICGP